MESDGWTRYYVLDAAVVARQPHLSHKHHRSRLLLLRLITRGLEKHAIPRWSDGFAARLFIAGNIIAFLSFKAQMAIRQVGVPHRCAFYWEHLEIK